MLPRDLIEMQILEQQPQPTESETQQGGTQISVLINPLDDSDSS